MEEQEESPSHHAGTRKGEEVAESEVGREDTGTTETGRPTGESTGRFSTGINPDDKDPIDPESPHLPTP